MCYLSFVCLSLQSLKIIFLKDAYVLRIVSKLALYCAYDLFSSYVLYSFCDVLFFVINCSISSIFNFAIVIHNSSTILNFVTMNKSTKCVKCWIVVTFNFKRRLIYINLASSSKHQWSLVSRSRRAVTVMLFKSK